MNNQRPIGPTESFRNHRRSMGDGTLDGRSRLATPYDPRLLRRATRSKEGGMPIGETVTLFIAGIEDGEFQFGGPVDGKTPAGFQLLVNGPKTTAHAYYDVIPDFVMTDGGEEGDLLFDQADLLLYGGTDLLEPVSEDHAWAEWDGIITTDVVRRGTQLRLVTDHPGVPVGQVSFRLVDAPQGDAVDPPGEIPTEGLQLWRHHFAPSNPTFTFAVPGGVEVGYMMVLSVVSHSQSPGNVSPQITNPTGWTQIDTMGSQLQKVFMRRATAGDVAGDIHTVETHSGAANRKVSLSLVAFESGFGASGNPFGTNVAQLEGGNPISIAAPSGGDFSLVVGFARSNQESQTGHGITLSAPAHQVAYGPSGVDERIPRIRIGTIAPGADVVATFGSRYTSRNLLAIEVNP